MALFRVDFCGRGELSERQQKLAQMLSKLQKISEGRFYFFFNPLSAILTKWSNTLKQFVDNLSTNCLSVFDHFVGLVLKGLIEMNFFNKNRRDQKSI